MPDRGVLLAASTTQLHLINPLTGAVIRSVSLTGSTFTSAPAASYLNGTIYLQTSTTVFSVDLDTGAVTQAFALSGTKRMISNDSASHLVTVSEGDVALADFARATYTEAAAPPVILSASNGFQLDSTLRVAVSGTKAGATLSFRHSLVAQADRRTYTVVASEGTTIAEFKVSDITRVPPSPSTGSGIEVYQKLPANIVQSQLSETRLGTATDFPVNCQPGQISGWTADSKPKFSLTVNSTVVPGATVELYANGTRVAGRAFSPANPILMPDAALPDGSYIFTALALAQLSYPSQRIAWQDSSPLSTSLNIDTTVPTAMFQYAYDAATPTLELTFSEPLINTTNLGSSVHIDRLDPSGNVIETISPSTYTAVLEGGQTMRFFSNVGGFVDGDYRVSVSAGSGASDRAGNPISAFSTSSTFILAGDANRDRVVNFDDLLILAQNYGQSGRTFSQGNINYSVDGIVDFDDLLLLAQRYGSNLVVAAPPATQYSKKRNAGIPVVR